jgi:hypothetical protein
MGRRQETRGMGWGKLKKIKLGAKGKILAVDGKTKRDTNK